MSLLLPLGAFAAILAAVTFGGTVVAAALLPPGSTFKPERWSWGFVVGTALVAAQAAATIALGASPGWIPTISLFAMTAALGLRARLREIGSDAAPQPERAALVRALLVALLASGVLFYLLRALTEPMWSNDYLAIWGLKGKTLFLSKRFPAGVLPPSFYAFSHPEYPLGLPLIYAGAASLLNRWDDHALALIFPFFQVATLAALFGWLRRRRVSWPVPLAAAALLSQLEPLYSGFLTGMAEVPLSCLFLLFGLAYSDCLDETDTGARRRLGVASFLSAALKNEGLLLAAAGAVGAMAGRRSARWRTAAACALPAFAVFGLTRFVSRGATPRDFDFAFLSSRIGELPARLAESLRVCFAEGFRPAWPVLACLALLFAAGHRTFFADRLLALAAACLVVYVSVPALAVLGPTWLVRTTLSRTAVALAPLVAAGLAGRFASPGGGRRKAGGGEKPIEEN